MRELKNFGEQQRASTAVRERLEYLRALSFSQETGGFFLATVILQVLSHVQDLAGVFLLIDPSVCCSDFITTMLLLKTEEYTVFSFLFATGSDLLKQ